MATIESTLIPYIRYKQVEFSAKNLKPFNLARIFFDDIVVNQYCQAGNRVIIDSKIVTVLTLNNTSTIYANDVVYQGSSNTDNTFNGIVDSWTPSTNTLIIRRSSRQDKSIGGTGLTGNFNDGIELYVENVTSGILYTKGNVVSRTSQNTADAFYAGEGVICRVAGNHYCTIISTSGDNIIYVNQNYINLNVGGLGNAISAMTNDFKVGDIVFQSSDGSKRYDRSAFIGEVVYYNKEGGGTSHGVIAIKPISGRCVANSVGADFTTNAATNARSYIWNYSNTAAKPLFAKNYNLDTFGSTGGRTIQSLTNASANVLINSYFPRSSLIANIDAGPNNLCINFHTSSTINRAVVGNLIYFTSGTGVGEIRRVTGFVSANPEILVLNSAPSFTMTGNTYFSVENMYIDSYGGQAGIFHIPEYPNLKFKTGNRVLSITDTNIYNDPDYKMRAAALYSATGQFRTGSDNQTTPILNILPEVNADALVKPISPSERTFNSDPTKSPVSGSSGSNTPRVPLGDSVSQTFFTPKPNSNKQNYGLFVSSVDLFFKSKPSFANGTMLLPVTVKIAEVNNGFPTSTYLGSSTVQFDKVKVSTVPSTSNTSTLTKFTFEDPIYLQPDREYAIVIQSDSPDYEVFVAELGDNVLGATPTRRISEQPYSGAFFRAQNSSTWAPYNNIDLMFVLNKAVFETSGTALLNLRNTPTANLEVDRVQVISNDLRFPVGSVQYSLRGTYAFDATQDNGLNLDPNRLVEYGSVLDRSTNTESSSFLNRRRIIGGNANSMQLTVTMSTSDPDISPVVNFERLAVSAVTYKINNGGLSNNNISLSNKGAGYNAVTTSVMANVIFGGSNNTINNYAQLFRQTYLANSANIGFYNITVSGGGGTGATGFAVANTDGMNTVNYIVVTTTGSGYLETPSITIANGNATSNTTATAFIAGETGKSGGNILAKYISREIILEDGFEAGDLRVFMDAVRPSPTDIQVYYKVLSPDDSETLSDKSWRRMEKYKDVYSRNPMTTTRLEFRPSLSENRVSYTENGINYPIGGKFKRFAVKVCLLSPDPSLVPKLDNLRIVATPEG